MSFAINFVWLNTFVYSSILLLLGVDKSDDKANVLSLLQNIMSYCVTNNVLFGVLKIISESIKSCSECFLRTFSVNCVNVIYSWKGDCDFLFLFVCVGCYTLVSY